MSQPPGDRVLRWLRTAAFVIFIWAVLQFFFAISWGAYGLPVIALVGVGLALLPGILYVTCGIVFGVIVGSVMHIAKFCKKCALPGR